MTAQLDRTACAICGPGADAEELYPANFSPADFNAEIFSARRVPDRVHYRMVRCSSCGLVRSDEIIDSETMAVLYSKGTFDYGDEIAALRRTYGRYLRRLDDFGVQRDALLEVGCGNGFFLVEALDQGYRKVVGVEPSQDAIARADPRVRHGIVAQMFGPGVVEPATFDVVCFFQVFDHVPDPGAVLDEALKALRPGGLILCLNHNVRAVSARLLGERSPIIDIEHTYLYDPATIRRLAEAHGFHTLHVGSVTNTYSPAYIAQLLPLPRVVKRGLRQATSLPAIRSMSVRVPLGNMYFIGRRPK